MPLAVTYDPDKDWRRWSPSGSSWCLQPFSWGSGLELLESCEARSLNDWLVLGTWGLVAEDLRIWKFTVDASDRFIVTARSSYSEAGKMRGRWELSLPPISALHYRWGKIVCINSLEWSGECGGCRGKRGPKLHTLSRGSTLHTQWFRPKHIHRLVVSGLLMLVIWN